MAGQDIKLNLTAKDDASKVIDKIGKSLDKTGESAKSAAEQIADELGGAANAMAAELKGAEKAADALASALGPELAAKADPRELVLKFRALGASFDDIEANADKLAASVKQLDDVSVGFDGVTKGAHGAGEEIDRSRSVLANFAGNAVQDLPGVSGAFGALNVAAGQFAEYASEGGIKLRGLLSALAPMAAGTVVIGLLANHFKNISETKAFNREKVDSFVDALRDGKTTAEALKDELIQTGEIKFRIGDMGSAKDLVPDLAKLNLTIGDYNALIEMAPDKVDAWVKAKYGVSAASLSSNQNLQKEYDAQKKLGALYGPLGTVLGAVAQAHDNVAAASLKQSQATLVAADLLKYTGDQAKYAGEWVAGLGQGVNAVEKAVISAGPGVEDLGYLFGTTAVHAGEMADEVGIAAKKLAEMQAAWEDLMGALDARDAQRAIDAAQERLDTLTRQGGRRPGKKQRAEIAAASDDVIRLRLGQAEKSGNAFLGPRILEVLIKPKVDEGSAADVARRLEMLAQLRVIPFEATLNTTRLGPLAPDGGLDPTAVATALTKYKRQTGQVPS